MHQQIPPNLRDEVLRHHEDDSPNLVLMAITALARAQARLLPPSPPSTPLPANRDSLDSNPSHSAGWSSSIFGESAATSRLSCADQGNARLRS